MKRYEYIGGSDAGCLLLDNKYRSKRDVWEQKVQQREIEIVGRDITRGHDMEPIIERYIKTHVDEWVNSDEAYDKYDAAYIESANDEQIFLLDDTQPFIGGHPDGISVSPYPDDEDVLWEFKAPRQYSVENYKRIGLPGRYIFQVQHYLMITGIKMGRIALWDYNPYVAYIVDIPADPTLHEKMWEEYEMFWNHVQSGIEPPVTTEIEHQHFTVLPDEELNMMARAYSNAKSDRYESKDIEQNMKGKLVTYLDSKERAVTDEFVISKKWVERKDYSNGGYYRLTVSERD
jgi:predicted phage-related endonuclease